MSKYIDLLGEIGIDRQLGTVGATGSAWTLRWLDEHPDQVPGRTITISGNDRDDMNCEWAQYRKDYGPTDLVQAHKNFCAGWKAARQYGRTMPEGQAKQLGYLHQIGQISHVDYAELMGITVVPDTEPTNAEKLADFLSLYDLDAITNYGRSEFARMLSNDGVKAPGGDDE